MQSVSRLAVSTWSPGVTGLYDAYRVERGKAHQHLNRKTNVLAALFTVFRKHYTAKTILAALISGNRNRSKLHKLAVFVRVIVKT